MATEPAIPAKIIIAETKALAALTFYAHNYTSLVFTALGAQNKQSRAGLDRRKWSALSFHFAR